MTYRTRRGWAVINDLHAICEIDCSEEKRFVRHRYRGTFVTIFVKNRGIYTRSIMPFSNALHYCRDSRANTAIRLRNMPRAFVSFCMNACASWGSQCEHSPRYVLFRVNIYQVMHAEQEGYVWYTW